jgi:ferredoxin-fold anticodon binding domain-containing protein
MNNIIRIPNIDNYHQAIINNELVLTPIYNYITLDELLDKNLTNSKINYCIITDADADNEVISNSIKYSKILIDIYKYLPASFNIKLTNENGNRGYTWYSEINMSVQGKDSNGTFKEIIKMINLNNYKIDIEIELSNGESINYKNN